MYGKYIQHSTKKHLNSHSVRDPLRVIASNKDKNAHMLWHFDIADNEGEEEDWFIAAKSKITFKPR